MPYFPWNDTLSVGIQSIDGQHKTLVELVNALHDEVAAPGGNCPALDLVERLKAYALEHFHIEEGYMQAFAYPGFKAHQQEHEAFSAAVQGFAEACQGGVAEPAAVLDFLKSWLTEHITGIDLEMGRFLKEHLR